MSADSAGSSKRPWLAALLSVLYPGLGHVYLRLWGRALLWFGSIVLATTLLIPPEAYPATFSIDAVLGMARELPLQVNLTILAMAVLNVADAYLMARRRSVGTDGATEGASGGEVSCPNCGKAVDEDLEFCQWCTEEL